MKQRDVKKQPSALALIKDLPYEELNSLAEETKADYKAKKIKCMNLIVDAIFAMLCSSQVSQRILSMENGVPLPEAVQGSANINFLPVAHSSLSEKLDKVNIEFFERAYDMICRKYQRFVPEDYLDEMSITRVDSTMVAETANKLKMGFLTGVNDRFSGDRKQLKYTMAYNGVSVTAARVFVNKAYSADNAPISKVVHESLRKRKDMSEYYEFDRGLTKVDDLNAISDHTKKNDAHFVGRLQRNRLTNNLEDLSGLDTITSDDELELVEDYKGYLRKSKSSKWDETHEYRFIRVRFKKPRPSNPSSAKSHNRRYDEDMLLITNDFETEAIKIAEFYRKRWDIEVFFKFLKQDLSFSHFISTSVHGIIVMLYLTLIVALLVKIYSITHNIGPRLARLAILNELTAYHMKRIRMLEKEVKRDRGKITELERALRRAQ